jgi:hypothetical protein
MKIYKAPFSSLNIIQSRPTTSSKSRNIKIVRYTQSREMKIFFTMSAIATVASAFPALHPRLEDECTFSCDTSYSICAKPFVNGGGKSHNRFLTDVSFQLESESLRPAATHGIPAPGIVQMDCQQVETHRPVQTPTHLQSIRQETPLKVHLYPLQTLVHRPTPRHLQGLEEYLEQSLSRLQRKRRH